MMVDEHVPYTGVWNEREIGVAVPPQQDGAHDRPATAGRIFPAAPQSLPAGTEKTHPRASPGWGASHDQTIKRSPTTGE